MSETTGSNELPAGQRGFCILWPTLFLQRDLPGADGANALLAPLILKHEAQHDTTQYLEQDFFAINHPVVDWLKTCVNKTVTDYLSEQKINYQVDWSLQGWTNINRRGDYHSPHNHPHSYLSGTYYVQMPEQKIEPGQRTDINPGDISFFDPRGQANMLAIAGDGQIESEHRVSPVSGVLLLWPSYLHHFVHPNLSDQERISVSFNIVLKWTDDFVPSQS